jgi:hypothetical protein
MKSLTTKNKMTGKSDVFTTDGFEPLDWGFRFFVEDELAAFKAAYLYRNSLHGVVVECAGGAARWMVTVFNESAASSGIDGAK